MKASDLLLVALLGVTKSTSADPITPQPPLPAEIQQLQQRRNEEVAKIDDLYVQALERNKLKYSKAGDLEKANLVQALIDQLRGKEQVSPESTPARELLLKSRWLIKATDGKLDYKISFREDGVVVREDTQEKWWKWNIDGKVLWCYWFTSGWIRFDMPEDPKTEKWKGKSKEGDRYSMEIVPPQ
jgi:hypothetical protein